MGNEFQKTIKITRQMNSGTIKFFNETKGFGFIKDSLTGDEIFFHLSGLYPGSVAYPGVRVNFEVKQGPRGPVAFNIQQA
jgi:CspA family cold shock protein